MELTQVFADPFRLVARLPDLDVVVRRIFPLTRFLEILRSKEMALIAPHLWDDPREDPAAHCMLDGCNLTPPRGQQALSTYLAPVWAQCWSLNPGSDTLLRAYSRVKIDCKSNRNSHRDAEGVIVTTTVRHLLAAAEDWHSDCADSHFVIGRVEYVEDEQIRQRIVNACNGRGPALFTTVQGRAESLMWKRTYFEHEQEVRLMLIARSWSEDQPMSVVRKVRFDPNKLFQSVSLDPRLVSFERMEREDEFREAGYSGVISVDPSYAKFLDLIEMQHDWTDS
jgi:hypothetical protein